VTPIEAHSMVEMIEPY